MLGNPLAQFLEGEGGVSLPIYSVFSAAKGWFDNDRNRTKTLWDVADAIRTDREPAHPICGHPCLCTIKGC